MLDDFSIHSYLTWNLYLLLFFCFSYLFTHNAHGHSLMYTAEFPNHIHAHLDSFYG